jgi:alkylation response protein AidB-like acyl-CoA dehydrogenase
MTATDEHQITESPELAEFRLKTRSFLAEHAPKRAKRGDDEAPAFEATIADLATQKTFQAALSDAGLAGLTWPKPWGQGLTSEHQRVFNEEAAGYELPTTAYIIGLGMVIPTMIEFGTDAQR